MFHHFHSDVHPAGQGSISGEQFAAILGSIDRERLLDAQEWQDRALHGKLRDTDVCVTFDDNLRCQYDIALPVLDAMGLTAFWFVYTAVTEGRPVKVEVYRYFRTVMFPSVERFYEVFFDAVRSSPCGDSAAAALAEFRPETFLEGFPFYTEDDKRFRFLRDHVLGPARYTEIMDSLIARTGFSSEDLRQKLWMGEPEWRRLHAAGHVIGLHSHTHPTRMAALSRPEQAQEYHANAEVLSRVLGSPVTSMSHPSNSYTPETLEILRGMGIRLGFRANMAPVPASELEYPREDHANLLKGITG